MDTTVADPDPRAVGRLLAGEFKRLNLSLSTMGTVPAPVFVEFLEQTMTLTRQFWSTGNGMVDEAITLRMENGFRLARTIAREYDLSPIPVGQALNDIVIAFRVCAEELFTPEFVRTDKFEKHLYECTSTAVQASQAEKLDHLGSAKSLYKLAAALAEDLIAQYGLERTEWPNIIASWRHKGGLTDLNEEEPSNDTPGD